MVGRAVGRSHDHISGWDTAGGVRRELGRRTSLHRRRVAPVGGAPRWVVPRAPRRDHRQAVAAPHGTQFTAPSRPRAKETKNAAATSDTRSSRSKYAWRPSVTYPVDRQVSSTAVV